METQKILEFVRKKKTKVSYVADSILNNKIIEYRFVCACKMRVASYTREIGIFGNGVKMVSEKSIEQKLRMETKKMGGWAVKFSSPGLDGMPDRLVFPGGKLGFVELKAPGKKMRPLQEKRKRTLEELGFLVFCVDSKEMIGGVLHEIRTL